MENTISRIVGTSVSRLLVRLITTVVDNWLGDFSRTDSQLYIFVTLYLSLQICRWSMICCARVVRINHVFEADPRPRQPSVFFVIVHSFIHETDHDLDRRFLLDVLDHDL